MEWEKRTCLTAQESRYLRLLTHACLLELLEGILETIFLGKYEVSQKSSILNQPFYHDAK